GIADVCEVATHRAGNAFAQRTGVVRAGGLGAGSLRARAMCRGRFCGLGNRQSYGVHGHLPSRTKRRLHRPLLMVMTDLAGRGVYRMPSGMSARGIESTRAGG